MGDFKPRDDEDSHQQMSRLKAAMKKIDADKTLPLTEFEKSFLETCLRGYSAGRYYSERQIPVAEKMIEKYLGGKS